MPRITSNDGQFQFSFRRQRDAGDLEYTPQSSTDLVRWETLTEQIGAIFDNGDGTETVTLQDDDLGSRKFGRVHVRLSQP